MSNNINTSKGIKVDYKPVLVIITLIITDLISLILSMGISYYLRFLYLPSRGGILTLDMMMPAFILITVTVVVLFMLNNFYPGFGRTGFVEFRETFKLITLTFILVGLLIYVIGFGPKTSRFIYIINWLLALLFVTTGRLLVHNRFSRFSWWAEPVVIVGNKLFINNQIKFFISSRRIGYRPIAAVSNEYQEPKMLNDVPLFQYSRGALQEIRNSKVKIAIIDSNHLKEYPHHLHDVSLVFPKLIFIMRDTYFGVLLMSVLDIDGKPALSAQYNLLSSFSQIVKRITDIALSIILISLAFPIFITISILIRVDSPGPIIYKQERMGKQGKIFRLYKFRTMKIDAETKLDQLLLNDEKAKLEYQKYHKLRNDPRITRVGKFLRKASLDELPQFINVIRGEMSWVGPRAYLPSELPMMKDYDQIIHRVKPGITGWWQVMGRHKISFADRLRMDEYYISNFSILMDLYILFKTIFVVLGGYGV